jgi:hypothetical protein
MAGAAGPNTAETGLVFAYDTGNTSTCFYGEPTTNIAYAVNNNLNSGGNWWVNGGNATFNDNDTSIPKPNVSNVNTSNLYIFSSLVTGTGSNQQLGSSIITINPSTTYSFSIWYYFTGTSMQIYPYVRTAVNNDLLAYFAYNGDTNGANWPKNQWLLLKATVTTQANETGIYMSSYTGTSLGDKVYYFGYQIEQKSHCTPLVLGTRSATQGLLNLTDNGVINITNASFDNNAQLVFDGTNDLIFTADSTYLDPGSSPFSIELLFNCSNASVGEGILYNKEDLYETAIHGGVFQYAWQPHWAWDGDSTFPVSSNTWYHAVVTYDGSYQRMYKNGVEVYNRAQAGNMGSNSNVLSMGARGVDGSGGSGYNFFPGQIPIVKAYKAALTAAEVLQNYQALRYRFGI